MMHKIADADQRARALVPELSTIIQAPAGSGKTELLIQRYLLLLARVENPEEIVSITFTRKAAAEMQSRVIRALQRAQQDEAPSNAHERQTWDLARAALQHAEQLDWQILQQPARLRIQTIDSLCAGLTRQMPVLSRLGAQPEIVEDAEALYLEASRRSLNELEQDTDCSDAIERLLSHMDNDLPRLEMMLVTMLKTRDQWLRHTLNANRRDELEAALARAINNSLSQLRGMLATGAGEELAELAAYAAQNLQEAGRSSPLLACVDLVGLPGEEASQIGIWQGLADLCLTAKGEWRKRVTVSNGFPTAVSPALQARGYDAKQTRARLLDCLAQLAGDDELRVHLAAVRFLPPATYSEQQWQVIESLFSLLIRAVSHLSLLFAETGRTDFAGISSAALEALGSSEEVTDLALALDYRIQHLLVDEFQDTSVTQYLLLERLTAGWQPGDGRSLMLVGDPMQSIYRFREAEVGLFLRVRQAQRLGSVALQPLQLTVNFRSERGIVEWVNQQFTQAFPAQENIADGAVSYANSEAMHSNTQPVSVQIHGGFGSSEDEALQVLAIINQARQQDPQGSIAILVRGRSHLLEISELLNRRGLSYRAVDIEPLRDRLAIREILALTQALNHPADRIAWLSVLRAPWCGLSLADLLALVEQSGATLPAILQDEAAHGALSATGQASLQRCLPVLMQALQHRQRRSLRRWVETTWLLLGGAACLQDESDLQNVQRFFELLEAHDRGGLLADYEELERAVEKLYAAPRADVGESLQLMTMHKAKGLEFDTVIIPGLARTTGRDDPRLLFWMERAAEAENNDLLLAPVKATGTEHDPHYQYLRLLEKDKGYLEDTRLLYVAATRAVRQLHLLGTVKVRQEAGARELGVPPRSSLLARLWAGLEPVFQQQLLDVDAEQHSERDRVAQHQLYRLPAGWQRPVLPDDVVWQGAASRPEEPAREEIEFSWASQTIRHVGIIVHACLQQISLQGIEQWSAQDIVAERWRQPLRAAGVMADELDEACRLIDEALSNTLEDPRAQWILDTAHPQAQSEYALTGIDGQSLVSVIIDRSFVDEQGTRWIIDYKTSRHQGTDLEAFLDNEQARYRAQLERYARIMAHLDDRPIRLGLYFPLHAGWREWAWQGDQQVSA